MTASAFVMLLYCVFSFSDHCEQLNL